MVDMPDRMTRQQAAAYLASIGCPITPGTLGNYATRENSGAGPPFTRFRGWRTTYSKADLDAWVAKHVMRVE